MKKKLFIAYSSKSFQPIVIVWTCITTLEVDLALVRDKVSGVGKIYGSWAKENLLGFVTNYIWTYGNSLSSANQPINIPNNVKSLKVFSMLN